MNKTKVVAIRLTQDAYDALVYKASPYKVSWYITQCLSEPIGEGLEHLKRERKKAEAKAKRLAKKEAASGL
jgi:hypothetical protein